MEYLIDRGPATLSQDHMKESLYKKGQSTVAFTQRETDLKCVFFKKGINIRLYNNMSMDKKQYQIHVGFINIE